MLDVLVASRAPGLLRPRWLSGSLLLHLVIAAVAVHGSRVESRPTGPVVAEAATGLSSSPPIRRRRVPDGARAA